MRIYTRSGDLAFKTFIFPDSQPHFVLETYERDFTTATIESSIKNPTELFQVLLAADVLRQHGFSELNLDIRYLLGARMDRAISSLEPYTLQVVARVLNGVGFSRIRILDVHSEVATKLIRNSSNVLPHMVVENVRVSTGFPYIVCPDKGAIERVKDLAHGNYVIYCTKHRDMATGALTGFHVEGFDGEGQGLGSYNEVLIVDDICDGGGTFVGLAKELRKVGAKKVYLYVTHGIFSKGLEALEGIDKIFTTDSYCQYAVGREFQRTIVIPISMKDL